MGGKPRASLTSRRLVPLDIKCNHLGTTEYWCRDCAWISADMLRREFEALDARLVCIAEMIDVARKRNHPSPREASEARGVTLSLVHDQILRLRRWP